MSQTRRPAPRNAGGEAGAGTRTAYLWWDAIAAVAAGMVAMWVVAVLGLWAAGAADLPGGGFARVVAAMVVIAVGGSVQLHGSAGVIAQTQAAVDAVPLSVTLVGALVTGAVFLRPLRHRAVASGREMLGRVARTAAVWLVVLIVLAVVARHTFRVSVGGGIVEDIGQALGATPVVGFRADVGPTVGFGLLWLLAVLALALVVSRSAPLPSRLLSFQEAVRPPAYAMLLVLLCYVVVGVVVGIVVAIVKGHPADTFAVVLLGLPNLVWMALGIGMGGSWEGHVTRGIGLPMPHVLDQVLHTRGGRDATLDLAALSRYDGRAWLLVVVAAVLLLAAGFLAARWTPARRSVPTRPWQHAWHMALAVGITMLVIGLLTRISAHYGLTLIGVGDVGGGLGGDISLKPNLFALVGLGLLWGLGVGFLGGLLAGRLRHPGEVT